MLRSVYALAVSALLVSTFPAAPAAAVMCASDDVPAATVLLPYFEVDWQKEGGVNTVVTLSNAAAEPALVHVTFWTDWSQATVDFDVFFTGYDVVVMDLYEIFQGSLPVTADEQTDPSDTISPHGLNLAWDGSFANCENIFPYSEDVILPNLLTRMRNGHSGQDVLGLGCMGEDHGDDLARGYITFDSVNQCSFVFPYEAGYFVDGGTGVANNRNVLWGSYTILEPSSGTSFGDRLVAIEADSDFNAKSTASGYTFYGRYDPGQNGADNREPLGFAWASEYVTDDTRLLVWRDSTANDNAWFYTCGIGPSWNPLDETEIAAFDHEENAVTLCGEPGDINPPFPGGPACFPLETQSLVVGEGDLALPYAAGWMFLNLNVEDAGVTGDVDFGSSGTLAQSHVAAALSPQGLYHVGYSAVVLATACEDLNPLITDTGEIPPFEEP